MKKVLLFVMVVALMGGILYMSGALPQEVVDAVVSHASATADKPVDAAVTLLARIRQTAGKDRASFEQLFRNTPDEVMDEYYTYDWSAYAPHHHSDTAHILAARQGQYAYVSLVFYTTSGNHPNTNRSSDFIALPLSLQGDQWLIEGSEQADAALQDALYALYPAPVVEAFHAKRNASLLAGGNFMYINPTSVYGLPPVFVPTSELVKTVRWHPHSFLGLATS